MTYFCSALLTATYYFKTTSWSNVDVKPESGEFGQRLQIHDLEFIPAEALSKIGAYSFAVCIVFKWEMAAPYGSALFPVSTASWH